MKVSFSKQYLIFKKSKCTGIRLPVYKKYKLKKKSIMKGSFSKHYIIFFLKINVRNQQLDCLF